MSGLAAGLARGLASYMQGRQIAEERDYQRAEAERARQAAERREAINAEYLRAQMGAMENNRANNARETELRTADTMMRLEGAGYQPVDAVRADGEQWRRSAPAFANSGQMAAPLMGVMADYMAKQREQQAAQRPAFTLNNTGYVKANPSREERVMQQALKNQQAVEQANADRRNRLLSGLSEDARAVGRGLDLSSLEAFATQEYARKQRQTGRGGSAGTGSGGASAAPRVGVPTEGERKAAALFGQAQLGYQTLEDLATASIDPRTGQRNYKGAPSLMDRAKSSVGMGVGNVVTGDAYRQMEQASLQLADAWLRYTSGANITEGEIARYAKTFTPLPGDDAQTLRQKGEARKRILSGLQAAAGRALRAPGAVGHTPSGPDLSVDNDRPPLTSFFGRQP